VAWWQVLAIVIGAALVTGGIVLIILARRSNLSAAQGAAYVRSLGVDLARLPGRLRRVAADPRTPRRARWWLIGLAVYIASPIDPIPDFLPVIGHLDEIILVPIILRHIRGMIPDNVWLEQFPPRQAPFQDRSDTS
jgi:uncharacterized membrane protein YkvA (DUF1232 family)